MPVKFNPNDKHRPQRAKSSLEKRWERIKQELEKPDDYVDEKWLRKLGFRPAGKYAKAAFADYAGGMALRLPGSQYLVHVVNEYKSRWRLYVVAGHQTWMVDQNGVTHDLGQLTRQGLLFIIEAAYRRGDHE